MQLNEVIFTKLSKSKLKVYIDTLNLDIFLSVWKHLLELRNELNYWLDMYKKNQS